MYAEFFGLRELPFNNTPDPRFFCSTPDHEEALASLTYAVGELKGFVLLTGEAGVGKTLVSRLMLGHFGRRVVSAEICGGTLSAGRLLASICLEFGLDVEPDDSPVRIRGCLQEFLVEQFGRNRPVVLILDEAQDLPSDAFEELRLVGNVEARNAKLMQVVIIGQPVLRRRFATRELKQLRHRLFRAFHLPALSRELTEEYIRHRLMVAGAEGQTLFDLGAIDRIYDLSRGVPRMINTVCDNAMLSAFSSETRRIDAALVDSVARVTIQADRDDEALGQSGCNLGEVGNADKAALEAARVEPKAPLAATPVLHDPIIVSHVAALERQLMELTSAVTRNMPPDRGADITQRVTSLELKLAAFGPPTPAKRPAELPSAIADRIGAIERRISDLSRRGIEVQAGERDRQVTRRLAALEHRLETFARTPVKPDPGPREHWQRAADVVEARLGRSRQRVSHAVMRLRSQAVDTEKLATAFERLVGTSDRGRSDRSASTSRSIESSKATQPELESGEVDSSRPPLLNAATRLELLRDRIDKAFNSGSSAHRLARNVEGLAQLTEELSASKDSPEHA